MEFCLLSGSHKKGGDFTFIIASLVERREVSGDRGISFLVQKIEILHFPNKKALTLL